MSVLKARILGLTVVSLLGIAARLPTDEIDATAMPRRFAFDTTTLNNDFGLPIRQTREVHPDLRRIQPWIASVGAAAAIGDIDGNLRPDDTCYIDTRINAVVVAPLLSERYRAFMVSPPGDAAESYRIAPMGCLIGDLNEDGLPDLLAYYWGRTPVAFLRIDEGPDTTKLVPTGESYKSISLAGDQRWYSNAALLADIDGDGHADLVVGNYFCDDGRILDSRTTEPVCPHPVMQDSMSRAYNGGGPHVMLWTISGGGKNPSVTYRDLPSPFEPEVGHGWTLAIGAHDLNSDGLPDLYFANDFGPDRLLVNCSHAQESFGRTRAELGCFPLDGPVSFRLMEGHRSFTKPRSKVLGQDSFKGMGVDFADINGDGQDDIYVSNITEKWGLQESQFAFLADGRRIDTPLVAKGEAPFSEESERLGLSRSGWGWDAKLADIDNDGQVEALQALGFVRGHNADADWAWRKSCWVMLQELATANDNLLQRVDAWFHMEQDDKGLGCDLSGNSRRNTFFVRAASGRFVDAAPWLPHLAHGTPAPTRGLAIGDADLDGRLDYIEARQYATPEFHHNGSAVAAANGFIGLSPRFIVGNQATESHVTTVAEVVGSGQRVRPAIGARVEVQLSDGRRFNADVDGGNGHSGKRSADIHIGLGSIPSGTTADLNITWIGTDGKHRSARFTGQPVGQHLAVLLQP